MLWIVVWCNNRRGGLNYVGPFATNLQAVLWETKFLREHQFDHTTEVVKLVPPS